MLTSLGQVLPAAAAKYGDKTALIADDKTFSFRELDQLSNALAISLTKLGVAPGDRVTLYATNSWEWLVSYYGVLKTGAVINPINVMLTPAEVGYVTRDCGAKVLIGSRDKVAAVLAASAGCSTNIVFGADTPSGALPFGELISRNASFDAVPVASEQLSTIGYTSGTTGHPKGAMQSHRAVILNGAMTAQLHAKTSADTVVTALPCPHVYGNVVFNGAMMFGLTLVLHPRFDAAEMLASIQTHRATMFEGVPTMYMYMVAHPDFDRYDVSSLTRCTVGGQTMPVAKMQEDGASLWLSTHRAVGHDRDRRPGNDLPLLRPAHARLDRHRASLLSGPDRVRDRCERHDAARRGWRADGQRPDRDARLLRQRRRNRARPSSPTAGCTPATSPAWTRPARCSWSTARRT